LDENLLELVLTIAPHKGLRQASEIQQYSMESEISMARSLAHEAAQIYKVGQEFCSHCLVSDGSLLGEEELWTTSNLSSLYEAFIDNPDPGKRTFAEKFKDQIYKTDNPDQIARLAGELVGVYFLFPSNVGLARKVELVSEVLDWGHATLPNESLLFHAFADGIGSGGLAYNTRRPFEIGYLIEFALAVKKLKAEERRQVLKDPWLTKDQFDALESAESRQIRHMLLHILHPDQFERSASRHHKRRIGLAFSSLSKGQEDIDKDLLDIRVALQALMPGRVLDFYQSPLVEVWNDPGDGDDATISMEALRYKKQLVFYGPPGTGKTHTAKSLAERIIRPALLEQMGPSKYFSKQAEVNQGIKDRIHRLQLHPAYGYEDFIRGLRINGAGGTEFQPGYLPRLIDRIVADDPAVPHVLLLDEMNRTDLSRMLGEAFSLLENRDEEIELAGANKDDPIATMKIPSNLYVIGTMNLIDLSIEQMDFALRRRFLWVHRGFDAEALVLAGKNRWEMSGSKLGWAEIETDFRKLADAAIALNTLIEKNSLLGKQYAIGHAYLLDVVPFLLEDTQDSPRSSKGYFWRNGKPRPPVEQIWNYVIKPILQEYLASVDATTRDKALSELHSSFVTEPGRSS
jgi:5-methylcytosine-specific restriction protein B